MTTPINILTNKEVTEFESPPELKSEDRKTFFKVDKRIKIILRSFDDSQKAGFILQLGYFKAVNKFYRASRFNQKDIQYLYFDRVVDRRSEATKQLNIPDPFDTDPSMAFFADQNGHRPSFQSTAQPQSHGGYYLSGLHRI